MPTEAPDAATAFERLDVTGSVDGAFVVLDLTQSYRNASRASLEAAYTFPLPVGAAVLGAWAEMGEATADAALMDAGEAESAYEAGLEAGRGTVLVERLAGGLCGVSLGPLAPGGRARVRLRVGLLLETRLDEARLVLPTVIARPQGSGLDAKLAPHARPHASFAAEYPLSLNLELVGRSAGVEVSSPSHDLVVTRTAGGRRVALTGTLDRDVVLVLEGFEPGVRLVSDGAGAVVVAPFPAWRATARPPIDLHVVIDATGSIAGAGVESAGALLVALAGELGRGDHLAVTRLGRRAAPLLARRRQGRDRIELAALAGFAADLGDPAGAGPLAPLDVAPGADLLFVTDGRSRLAEGFAEAAAKVGRRLFVLGVGAAPDAEPLRRAAGARGGVYVGFAPADLIEATVRELLAALITPTVEAAQVIWPCAPTWEIAPQSGGAGFGDTIIAGFERPPSGPVEVRVRCAGELQSATLTLPPVELNPLYVQLATAARTPGAAGEWSLRSGRLGAGSAWLAADLGPARPADGAPAFRPTPQMIAAGVRGLGRLAPPQPTQPRHARRIRRREAAAAIAAIIVAAGGGAWLRRDLATPLAPTPVSAGAPTAQPPPRLAASPPGDGAAAAPGAALPPTPDQHSPLRLADAGGEVAPPAAAQSPIAAPAPSRTPTGPPGVATFRLWIAALVAGIAAAGLGWLTLSRTLGLRARRRDAGPES